MFLLVRSDTDLISGRATRMATRRSPLFDDADAGFSATPGNTTSAWSEWPAFCSGAGAAVAAVTRSCVPELETATAFLAGCESAIGACRMPLEFGAAGFARRTRVADLDPSPRIPVAPRGFSGSRGTEQQHAGQQHPSLPHDLLHLVAIPAARLFNGGRARRKFLRPRG